jgi:hypothetical protein
VADQEEPTARENPQWAEQKRAVSWEYFCGVFQQGGFSANEKIDIAVVMRYAMILSPRIHER